MNLENFLESPTTFLFLESNGTHFFSTNDTDVNANFCQHSIGLPLVDLRNEQTVRTSDHHIRVIFGPLMLKSIMRWWNLEEIYGLARWLSRKRVFGYDYLLYDSSSSYVLEIIYIYEYIQRKELTWWLSLVGIEFTFCNIVDIYL